jgi:hypothetical protein
MVQADLVKERKKNKQNSKDPDPNRKDYRCDAEPIPR